MALTKITSRILDSSGVTILGTIATGVWQGTPIADDYIASAATWNTASTDRLKWDGGATGLTASTGRTSLGLGTVATTAASDYATAAQGTKADTAHGWGNHTGGGYVKTTTDQTIAGVKTFSSNLKVEKSLNGDPQLLFLTNPNSGTATEAVIYVGNAALGATSATTFMQTLGTGFSSTGGFIQDGSVIGTGTDISGGLSLIVRANADMRFYTNGHTNQRMIISSGGDVGIGTTSPNYLLDLQSSVTGLTHNLKLNKGSATGDYAEIAFQLWNGAGSGLNTFGGSGTSRPSVVLRAINEASNSAAGAFVVGTFTGGANNSTLTEKFRISSEGAANFTGSVTNAHMMTIVNSKSTPYGIYQRFMSEQNNESSDFIRFQDGAEVKFYVYSNGNVKNKNNSYSAISDVKLKENIVDTPNKLNDILKVKVRNYNFKNDNLKQIGVIAQELESIFPSLVSESPDTEIIDKKVVDLGTTTKSVKYSVFVPILIKAIQEQQAQIELLKQEVELLKQ